MNAALFLPPLTSFIGREREIVALVGRLADPACRLLCLVGPGGIGKTRLAAEVAARCRDRFPGGVAIVPLVGATLPAHIPGAVASALGLPLLGAGDGWSALASALGDREQLLVFDNVEQLAGAAAPLAALLRAAPRLKLLVTTREALGLQEEWRWPVVGLEVPLEGEGAVAEQTDAVRLFVARARQQGADEPAGAELEAVARICRLVGGMPLAIELAAAWTSTLSCREIAAEIAGGLELLATELHNVPARHRSVSAIFDQTWARLAPDLRLALARLAVFPGSCTREAAAAVAEAPVRALTQLVERALLQRTTEGRYELHPLVRQYAGQQLAAMPDVARAAEAACGRYYARLLSAQFLRSKSDAAIDVINIVRPERANIRAALPAILAQTTGEPLRQALYMIHDVYFTCGPYHEGVELIERAEAHLRRDGTREAGVVRAHMLTALGLFEVRRGNLEAAREHFETSSALFTALGAVPLSGDATDPEFGLGLLALIAGDYRAADRHGERVRARAEATGQQRNLAYSWYLRAEAAQAQGLFPAAHTAARNALELTQATGAVWFDAYVRNQIGQIAAALGRHDEADEHFRAGYATREAFGDREGMAVALLALADSAAHRGDHAGAVAYYEQSLGLYAQTDDRGGTARALLGLGAARCALGAHPSAWAHMRAALELARALDYQHVMLDGIVCAAAVLVATGRPERAPAPLALALVHPASRSHTTLRAQGLLSRCEELLPPVAFAAAVARGRGAPLDALVDELLALNLTSTALHSAPLFATESGPGASAVSVSRTGEVVGAPASGGG